MKNMFVAMVAVDYLMDYKFSGSTSIRKKQK